MATMSILADHYPERLHKVFLVDAPSVFSVLWTLLSPFIDPVTRAKIHFVRGADFTAGGTPRADPGGFAEYAGYWAEQYDEGAYRALLEGKGGGRGKGGGAGAGEGSKRAKGWFGRLLSG